MSQGTAVAELPTKSAAEKPAQRMPVLDDGEFALLFDSARFEQAVRVARVFAQSELVPEIFQGKDANCLIALNMAIRLQIDPMMLMQRMYIVHGKPGIEAQLAIALINSRGPFKGPIQWELTGEGMGRSCTAFAIHKVTSERCAVDCTMQMAKAEGWYDKSGSKWKTIPDMMLRYRSATFLGRLYAPECLMGINTVDELLDIGPMSIGSGSTAVDTPPPATRTDSVKGRLAQSLAAQGAAVVHEGERVETVDKETGEITTTAAPATDAPKGEPKTDASKAPSGAQQPTQSELIRPTMNDVHALIAKGEFDQATDIANSIGGDAIAETQNAIAKHKKGK